jgi:hypothetical protein
VSPRIRKRGFLMRGDKFRKPSRQTTVETVSTLAHMAELLGAAKRIFWFGTPEEALEFPLRFLTYVMTYASDEDINIVRKYFGDDDFKAALDDPAPGIFDQSSWTKWNQRYGRTPIPPFRYEAFQE